jgi:DnaJ-class molecular chaperone
MTCVLCHGSGNLMQMLHGRPAFWTCPACGGAGCWTLFARPTLKAPRFATREKVTT